MLHNNNEPQQQLPNKSSPNGGRFVFPLKLCQVYMCEVSYYNQMPSQDA